MFNGRFGRSILSGVYSGLVTGILSAARLLVYFTLVLIIAERSLGAAGFFPLALIYGLPIGLLVGLVYGLALGVVALWLPLANHAPSIGFILGAITGSVYGLAMLFINVAPLAVVLAHLIGGVAIGGYSGRSGGRMFSRRLAAASP